MPPMTTHCVLLLCGAGCLPVIASSYLRSGTKPPDKDLVNCPARAEPHSPQRGEHSNLDCDYLRVFRLHNQGDITDCSLLLRPRLFRGVTPYRRDGESPYGACLACTFRLPTSPMQYFKGGCGPLRRMCHTPYYFFPVFSPHQARWYLGVLTQPRRGKNV